MMLFFASEACLISGRAGAWFVGLVKWRAVEAFVMLWGLVFVFCPATLLPCYDTNYSLMLLGVGGGNFCSMDVLADKFHRLAAVA